MRLSQVGSAWLVCEAFQEEYTVAKYVFFNFPAHGHVNPTLAIVEELIARGEEVVYYLTEAFRQTIEATGATFRASHFRLSDQGHASAFGSADVNRQLAMLPMYMIQKSGQMVPPLLESVRAEQADCIVCDRMFLWARMVAHILHIPAVALCPTYAMNAHFNLYASFARNSPVSPDVMASLNNELAQLSATYGVPLFDTHSLRLDAEPLTLVFLPRAFQPAGETFDEHFLFVGPSLQARRHESGAFPLEQVESRPTLYISLGTVFNDQVDFYQICFAAFGDTEWQVVLSLGTRVDRAALQAIPHNFLAAAHVPQLEVLPHTDIFLSHGGMNSVMESLSYGVPLIVIPHILEQEATAQRVQELGLGIALDKATITTDVLREAVAQVAHDPTFRTRAQAMQQTIHEAGGYQRATDAIMHYARAYT